MLLTHTDSQDYFDYVRAIKRNPIAVNVKLADLRHNGDQPRSACTNADTDRLADLRKKYEKAIAILTEE